MFGFRKCICACFYFHASSEAASMQVLHAITASKMWPRKNEISNFYCCLHCVQDVNDSVALTVYFTSLAATKAISKEGLFWVFPFQDQQRSNTETHPPADLWPILVQLQSIGQSRTGLRPYPRSCDHEFTSWWISSRQKKIKVRTAETGVTGSYSTSLSWGANTNRELHVGLNFPQVLHFTHLTGHGKSVQHLAACLHCYNSF